MSLVECRTGADVFQNRDQVVQRLKSVRAVPDDGIDLKRGKIGGRKGSDPLLIEPSPPPLQVPTPPLPPACDNLKPIWIFAPELAFVFDMSPLYVKDAASRAMFDGILHVICRHYNKSKADLRSQQRTKDVVWPRQVACYFARQLTQMSMPAIGRLMGGRDHSTILSAVRKVQRLRDRFGGIDAELSELEQQIQCGFVG